VTHIDSELQMYLNITWVRWPEYGNFNHTLTKFLLRHYIQVSTVESCKTTFRQPSRKATVLNFLLVNKTSAGKMPTVFLLTIKNTVAGLPGWRTVVSPGDAVAAG
jgi:hypothetical protein